MLQTPTLPVKVTNLNTVDLFKVMVAERTGLNLNYAVDGFVTDFTPSQAQLKALKDKFVALPVTTLFTVLERQTASVEELIAKQILHYIEVYGLESPGLFQLETTSGRIATLTYVKAVTVEELAEKIHALIYANRPIADVQQVVDVMREYGIQYDINEVKNNELKVVLFDPTRDKFTSGDDAVRWICWDATKSALLIKDRKTINTLQRGQPHIDWFLKRHTLPLAQVFNRHKRLLMACKNPSTASTINKISKLSKIKHQPIHEPVAKRFISGALNGTVPISLLAGIPLRDKLKYLNLIEYKLLGLNYDSFQIRNGKVWFELNRPHLNNKDLRVLCAEVLNSVYKDIKHLEKSSILIDPNVDYGLPVSRKQSVGNLPFGTRVTGVEGQHLSAGIYWHNGEYGSIDLDLSAIDSTGSRTGWGQLSGYSKNNPIMFSGDLTDASNGATEWMVVSPDRANRYGLMVNICRGPDQCDAAIVVGHPSGKSWQDHTFVKEKIVLQSKQSLIGFLKDDAFIVYSGRLNENRMSHGKHPILDKGLAAKLWTVRDVLDAVEVKYDTAPKPDVTYDHDLRYMGFTQDKLEGMFRL